MRKSVIIVDCSSGNESVGEMWKQTKIFEFNNTIEDVFNWVNSISNSGAQRKNIVITFPSIECETYEKG